MRTPEEKRRILKEFIEVLIRGGYEISEYMGRPLSWFDYDKVLESTRDIQEEIDSWEDDD